MTDILIIDDDPVYGELSLERLEATSFTAQFFLGPFGSVNMIRQVMPRLLILDINMPGLDGTAIIDLVWRSRTHTGMRVMFNSSLDYAELAALAEKHGADCALSKSTKGDEFIEVVKRLLSSSSRTATASSR